MRASELETTILEAQGIRIVIRCDPNTLVKDYPLSNRSNQNWTVKEFLEKVIHPLTGEDLCVTVINGNGTNAHGNAILSTVRTGYKTI